MEVDFAGQLDIFARGDGHFVVPARLLFDDWEPIFSRAETDISSVVARKAEEI